MAVPRTVALLRCSAHLAQYLNCNLVLIPRFAKTACRNAISAPVSSYSFLRLRVLCAFLGSAFCQCGRRPPDRLRLLSLPLHLQCNPREGNSAPCILWQPSICTVISFRQRPAADVERLARRSRLAERPVSPSRILRSSPALARWEFLR